ncbi:MAG TPA: vWA domain-containing protein [Vicinamibacterales bacterium]|nr:vWA domain-containing protein [Vicinamibacterales bacterium]
MLGIDLETVRFAQPQYLWLLIVPGVLLIGWFWQLTARRRDARRYRQHRRLPVRERFPVFGSLVFWLCLILASACVILALSRPTATAALVRTAGVDLVVLQDGSASMRTMDVPGGNRWQRSMRFLRVLGESLAWRDDRMAMALFAHIAAPQVRLTKDPNTFFFFLDHLAQDSPFRMEDDTTWDTNIELGIAWGMRLIEKDTEIYGKSPNAKTFVLVTDGQAWSGEVARALKIARTNDVPVWVVGVGTTLGGFIPEPPKKASDTTPPEPPVRAALDRPSLQLIANAGGGEYLELDREGDREIANKIIDASRRRAGSRGLEAANEELYWRFLLAAAVLVTVGLLFLQERIELWLQATGAAVALTLVWTLTR